MRRPRLLMCSPDFYGIHYEINPWMNRRREVEHAKAMDQWTRLHSIVRQCGADIELLAPVQGLPDLVFTANAGLVFGNRVIVSRFRHPQRQGEEPLDAAWFAENGLSVTRLPDDRYFEGAGDALFCGETLFAGYRTRSDVGTLQSVARMLGCRVIPMELVDPYYYHLDTCFCPLRPGLAVYYPAAFDEYGQKALREHVEQLLPVELEEARAFACNAVVIGTRVITNTGCPRLHAALAEHGYEPIATPLSEFVKAGGSAKCLTLRLDGEEAASWKTARAS